MKRRSVRTAGHPRMAVASAVIAFSCAGVLPGCIIGAGDDNPGLGPHDGGTAGDARPADGATPDARSISDGASLDANVSSDRNMSDRTIGEAGSGDAAAPPVDATLQDASAVPESGGTIQINLAPIDMGMIVCGSQTSAPQTLLVKNVGTGRLGISAMTTVPAFQVSPTSLSLAPGAELALSLTASIPSTATAGSRVTGSLNLFTTDATNANLSIQLSATAGGATLAFGMLGTTVGFGTWPVGTAAQVQSFTIQNIGNVPATFTIGSPSNAEFSLSNVPDGGTSVTLAGQQILTLAAGFTPTAAGAQNGSVDITPEGMLCQTSGKQTISLNGSGTLGNIVGPQPSALTFNANCGGQAPPPQTFTLTNLGGAAVNVTAAQFDNPDAGFTVSPTVTTIPGGDGGVTFTVNAPPFPSQLDGGVEAGSMPPPIQATLNITATGGSDAGGPITLHAIENPVGASLTFSVPNQPVPSLQFNSVAVHGTIGAAFNVVNSGSDGGTGGTALVTLSVVPTGPPDAGAGLDAQAVGGAPAPFTLDTVAPFAVTPGVSHQFSENVTFNPIVVGATYAKIVMNVDPSAVLCAPLPPPLPVQGIGSGLSVGTSGVTFYAPCDGKTNSSAPFILTNTTDASVSWAVSDNDITGPGKGLYTVGVITPDGGLDKTPGLLRTLAPSQIASVGVFGTQPMPSAATADGGVLMNDAGMPWVAPNPANLAALLTIAAQFPNGASAGPAVVSLNEVPVGDQLSVALGGVPVTNIAFGLVPVGTTPAPQQTVFVANSANPVPAATYSGANFSLVSTAPAFGASSVPLPLAAGATAPVNVSFTPTNDSPVTATLKVSRTDPTAPLCAPLPAPIALSGTGTQGLPAVTPMTLNFGLVDCGTTTPPMTVTVTNQGNQPFNVNAATFAPSSKGYTYKIVPAPTVAAPVVVAANAPAMFAVSATVPAEVLDPTNSAAVQDTLTLTTNAQGDQAHVITLGVQAHGAVIVDQVPALSTIWNFPTVTSGTVATIVNQMQNTGNGPVTVSLTAVAPQVLASVFDLAPNPTTAVPPTITVPPMTTTPIVGRFTPNATNASWTGQGTLTVSGPLCKALPPQWGGSPNMGVAITTSGSSN